MWRRRRPRAAPDEEVHRDVERTMTRRAWIIVGGVIAAAAIAVAVTIVVTRDGGRGFPYGHGEMMRGFGFADRGFARWLRLVAGDPVVPAGRAARRRRGARHLATVAAAAGGRGRGSDRPRAGRRAGAVRRMAPGGARVVLDAEPGAGDGRRQRAQRVDDGAAGGGSLSRGAAGPVDGAARGARRRGRPGAGPADGGVEARRDRLSPAPRNDASGPDAGMIPDRGRSPLCFE